MSSTRQESSSQELSQQESPSQASSPQEVTITRIGREALPRVQALAQVIWPECFGELLGDKIPAMLEAIYAPQVLERDMAESGHVFWLAQAGGQDAGFAAAYAEGQRLWIRKLYVRAEFRRLGVGRRLMAAARAQFPQAGELALNVNAGNEAAIAFYRASGFAVEATVPVTMGPYTFTDYVMVKAPAAGAGVR